MVIGAGDAGVTIIKELNKSLKTDKKVVCVIDDNKNYFYEIDNNTVYLKTDEEIVSTYKCTHNCNIYSTSSYYGRTIYQINS